MEWLQLVYKVPAEPSRKRTYIWRQLRGLGAVYLQDACCVLPRTPESERRLGEVAAKVREFGGVATLSALGPAEPGWEERLVAAVNHARDEEYQELLDTTERFEEEVARETRKGKFTFAALEEIEDDFERLERWLARVRERDVFAAALRAEAEERLAQARRVLEAFRDEVHGRERAHAAGGDDANESNHVAEPGDVSASRPSSGARQ
ncbi:MAG TPA: Chromate resistance protein ChrB [Chloroflexota bacterium]|nr:Chromate resistance protein ChrB [Chloroflexota bacterium]